MPKKQLKAHVITTAFTYDLRSHTVWNLTKKTVSYISEQVQLTKEKGEVCVLVFGPMDALSLKLTCEAMFCWKGIHNLSHLLLFCHNICPTIQYNIRLLKS